MSASSASASPPCSLIIATVRSARSIARSTTTTCAPALRQEDRGGAAVADAVARGAAAHHDGDLAADPPVVRNLQARGHGAQAGQAAGCVPSGTVGRDQNAGVSESRAAGTTWRRRP